MKLDHTGSGVCVQENKTKDERVSTRAGPAHVTGLQIVIRDALCCQRNIMTLMQRPDLNEPSIPRIMAFL